jgi:Ankyrin repeats (3 copies)
LLTFYYKRFLKMQNIQSYPNPCDQPDSPIKKEAAEARSNTWHKVALATLGIGPCIVLGAGIAAAITFSAVPLAIAGAAALITFVAYKSFAFMRDIDKPLQDAPWGWGRLHQAAAKGQVMRTKLLLFLGANPNAKSGNGDAPLHMACFEPDKPNSKDHIKVMELLVKAGANVNAKGSAGRCPLHYAVYTRHADRSEFLVNHGAYINFKQSCSPDYSPWKYAEEASKETHISKWIGGDPRSDSELLEADKHIYTVLKEKGKVYSPEMLKFRSL